MDFDEFKSTLMDLVTKEIEDRELEGISMKFDTINSPDGMTDRLIVSVAQLQKMLRICRPVVYELIRDKKVRALKVGRCYRITKQSVIDLIFQS